MLEMNSKKCGPQLVNNCVINQVTQIRNTSTITDSEEVIPATFLIDNFSHQHSDDTNLENMTLK
jgi:hypothetical protein